MTPSIIELRVLSIFTSVTITVSTKGFKDDKKSHNYTNNNIQALYTAVAVATTFIFVLFNSLTANPIVNVKFFLLTNLTVTLISYNPAIYTCLSDVYKRYTCVNTSARRARQKSYYN